MVGGGPQQRGDMWWPHGMATGCDVKASGSDADGNQMGDMTSSCCGGEQLRLAGSSMGKR